MNKNVPHDLSQSHHLKPTLVKNIENLEDIENLISENRIVVCKLHANWCQPCKSVTPKFEELAIRYDSFKDLDKNTISFCSIDIDDHEYYAEQVHSIPAFFMYVNGIPQKNDIITGGDLIPVETYIIEQITKISKTTKV
jgi:thiol-disulfide isomerase/thioredoxin